MPMTLRCARQDALSDEKIGEMIQACRGIKDELAVVVPLYSGNRIPLTAYAHMKKYPNADLSSIIFKHFDDLPLDTIAGKTKLDVENAGYDAHWPEMALKHERNHHQPRR